MFGSVLFGGGLDPVPDGVLWERLLALADTNDDSSISVTEAEALTTFTCSGCPVEDLTGMEAFVNLETFDLYAGSVSDLTPIAGLSALRVIEVRGNRIEGLPTPNAWSQLEKLDVSGNRLTSLPGLSGWPALDRLEVDHNRLTQLPTLADTHLSVLRCGFNSLSELPALPAGLTSLDCTGNQLTALPDLSQLTALTQLHLSGNQLTELVGLEPVRAQLTHLYFDGNPLTQLPDLRTFPALTSLGYGSTVLETLPDIDDLDLAQLKVGGPVLTAWPDLPPGLSLLQLCCSDLTTVPALPHELGRLYLSHLPHLAAAPEMFELSFLTDLTITRVGIDRLPILPLELINLTVWDTTLDRLPDFEHLGQLRRISLRNNRLTEAHALAQLPMGNVTSINIQNNLIPNSDQNCETMAYILEQITPNLNYQNQGDSNFFWQYLPRWGTEQEVTVFQPMRTLDLGPPGPAPYTICD
ncbi:leucine-rich repeat domain-containing protein [Sulfidibacter corallicola]|uniref:Leucine-rich repeat domain-containing protein n=1 Tax=Sulfidibacter corallicola TaxID=2818388 RepID=A0A8A4TS65_SULCO|nr:leucine-rich repeat domain-containing protein [Sulfidibacter corallicola]QTD52806.1 leucine-rich repeat domain-containing protein [Sulfidibacter corallicola]